MCVRLAVDGAGNNIAVDHRQHSTYLIAFHFIVYHSVPLPRSTAAASVCPAAKPFVFSISSRLNRAGEFVAKFPDQDVVQLSLAFV